MERLILRSERIFSMRGKHSMVLESREGEKQKREGKQRVKSDRLDAQVVVRAMCR